MQYVGRTLNSYLSILMKVWVTKQEPRGVNPVELSNWKSKNQIMWGGVDSSVWWRYVESLCSGFQILVPKNIYMPNDANKRYLPSSRLRRSILLDRAHVLQRVNVAPLAMLHHAHAPSHVNISYAYLFVYLQIQIYNEDKRWSGETSCISS